MKNREYQIARHEQGIRQGIRQRVLVSSAAGPPGFRTSQPRDRAGLTMIEQSLWEYGKAQAAGDREALATRSAQGLHLARFAGSRKRCLAGTSAHGERGQG
jgi:hypothetical protein